MQDNEWPGVTPCVTELQPSTVVPYSRYTNLRRIDSIGRTMVHKREVDCSSLTADTTLTSSKSAKGWFKDQALEICGCTDNSLADAQNARSMHVERLITQTSLLGIVLKRILAVVYYRGAAIEHKSRSSTFWLRSLLSILSTSAVNRSLVHFNSHGSIL